MSHRSVTRLLLCMLMFGLSSSPAHSTDDVIPNYEQINRIERPEAAFSSQTPEFFSFSPDGNRLAASMQTNIVGIWQVDTGELRRTIHHTEEYYGTKAVIWSPDGRFIAIGQHRDPLFIVDAATGFPHPASQQMTTDGFKPAWSSDGSQLLQTYGKSHLQHLDIETGNITSIELDTPLWSAGMHIFWSPDGSKLAVTDYSDETYLLSPGGEWLAVYRGSPVVSWSPDSIRLASAGQIRDVTTHRPVQIFQQMRGAIAWHPHNEWIVSSDGGTGISLRDAETGRLLTGQHYPDCEISNLAWSADGNRFAFNCFHVEETADSQFISATNDLIIMERTP